MAAPQASVPVRVSLRIRAKRAPPECHRDEETLVGELILGDCVEELKRLPDRSAQLIIADPPYNIGPAFGIEQEWTRSHDWLPWVRLWLTECERILAPGGPSSCTGFITTSDSSRWRCTTSDLSTAE
ncbi:hypothetical protein ET471_03645 [Xylanimonas protaetiae]|uniref:DNA methylase N-4/N-6 domain-containing protein n=1 Tax=Xylanimonas protaetiae TaxID=2509457 RepID=A0A4V0YGM4_9MICO|nr:hypothetical protein ET471_03645 [Xylanimonas protaetiae]